MSYGFIYITTNLISGKSYVGKRVIKNNKKDETYLGSGKILKQAIEKHGIENFSRVILEYCNSEEELIKNEENYIKLKNNLAPNGYNISKKGTGGDIIHEKNKQKVYEKLSKSLKRYHDEIQRIEPNGFRIPKDVRDKISKAHLGKKKSKEHSKKNSEAQKKSEVIKKKCDSRRKNNKEWHTDSTRKKISEKRKGYKHSEEWKKEHSKKLTGKPRSEHEIERMRNFMTDGSNKVSCQKCSRTLNKNNYQRHFIKCNYEK